MFRSVVVVALVSVFVVGCASKKQNPLTNVTGKSYEIAKDMNQSVVNSIMPMKPTSVQRIDNREVWKYEGNLMDEKLEEGSYHNVMIVFEDGKVKNVGAFNCKLPYVPEK